MRPAGLMRRALPFAAVLVLLALVVLGLGRLGRPADTGLVPVTGAPYAAQPATQPTSGPAAADLTPLPALAPAPADDLPVVDPGWLTRTAEKAGIPETALRAYARASLRAPRDCGLGWTTLAAIGYVESRHGTLGDRVLGLDGVSSTPIVGPALDGEGGFGAIASSETGRALHGDGRWDHAVGPMQFITATWEQWGADGDGDGRVDPQDVDDAAWAAARYLCTDGRDLTSGVGWSGGVFSYNHSQAYLDSIYAAATAYAERTS